MVSDDTLHPPFPSSSPLAPSRTPRTLMNYVLVIFFCFVVLLICANTRSRRTMTAFLKWLGVSVRRIPRVINELKRKGFHFSGLVIPVIYIIGLHTELLDQYSGSIIMIFVSAISFAGESLRLMFPNINKQFGITFNGLLREKERNNFTGTFFYLVGATISIVFFRCAYFLFLTWCNILIVIFK